MGDKLRQSGIEPIGYIPWGTHFSQLYEDKEDLVDILVPYFKAGLENNEFCLWITSNIITREHIEEAMNNAMPNFNEYLTAGQIQILTYHNFYLDKGNFDVDNLIKKGKGIYDEALLKGYYGLRISTDESWIERKYWKTLIEYEKELNNYIASYRIIFLCTYSYAKCEAADIIDIIQAHQSVLIRKDQKWTVVESIKLKATKEKLERVNRLYSILSKVNHAIVRIRDPKLLYKEACRIAVEDGFFRAAWIGIVNIESNKLDIIAQCGFDKNEECKLLKNFTAHKLNEFGLITKAVNKCEQIICHDVKEELNDSPLYIDLLNCNIESCAVFPLKSNDNIIGVMMFYSNEDSFIENEEIKLLNSLCDDISFVVNSIEKEAIRKQMEEELRQSEERYRKIFEISPAAILVHTQFIIEYANLAAAKLLGAENPDVLVGNSILNYIDKDYHHLVIERKRKIKHYGVAMPFEEEKYLKLDGTVIDVEATGALFPYKEKNAMVSVVRDITERKKLEQLRVASEENERLLNEAKQYDILKTEFFANLSHELRTPINVILSAIQLLNLYTNEGSEDFNNKNINKYIFTMQQNCYRLLRLVSNIIDITKIDAGFFDLELTNCNIVNIVEDITLSVSEYIEQKGITLIFDTEVEERIMACDSDKIDRIMLNLLSNAVKFTNPGGKIMVNIYDREDKVVISVKDNGIGISKVNQKLIFERFHQVDKSLTRSHEGSGIGLSIVKSLVELHEGNITVKSEYKKGTEFIIELPVKFVRSKDSPYNNTNEDNIEKINIEFSDIYT
jgi:PAS domain S-box-containing protein